MTEVWKDVKNYEGLYQISNLGNVKRISSGKRLKPYNRKGYIWSYERRGGDYN